MGKKIAVSETSSPAPQNSGLHKGALTLHGESVLSGVPPAWRLFADATGTGVFLGFSPEEPGCYATQILGRIAGLERFTSCHRFVPFWIRPVAGSREAEIKPQTLWILAKTETGAITLLVSLIGQATHYAFQASGEDLMVAAETGDPALPACGETGCEPAVFVATGKDPYVLLEAAARAVAARLGCKLRAEKKIPDSVDLFGWCTWNAFYKDVSPEKVTEGLESFRRCGIVPPLVILDDGWQASRNTPQGEELLADLSANATFGGDLASLVRVAKEHFGVRRFFVWHAFLGYWGGVCEEALPGYEAMFTPRNFGPGILAQDPTWNVGPWGARVSVPSADGIGRFYEDYHSRLAAQGIDGVKVDAQAMLEGVAAGRGGRVALHRAYRRALDASAAHHFEGRLINCMAATSECAYLADSLLFRASDDFFPDRPETHGPHLYANAQVGAWFGEFLLPDWDMFQSGHPSGAFHAAARAVSGGPVYVSDRPREHDFAFLWKLTLADGTVLRADLPGRPTPDCLFRDPTRENVLLKIFNMNRDCGVVGLFHVGLGEEGGKISGTVSPADIPPLAPGEYAAFAHQGGRLWRAGFGRPEKIELAPGGWEIVSFAPLEHGFAAFGLADKLNSASAVLSRTWDGPQTVTVRLRDGGKFLAWSDHRPDRIMLRERALDFSYSPATRQLAFDFPAKGECEIRLSWKTSRPPTRAVERD